MTISFHNAGNLAQVTINGNVKYFDKTTFSVSAVDGTYIAINTGGITPFMNFAFTDCSYPTAAAVASLVTLITNLMAVEFPLSGGAKNEVYAKVSNTDYDFDWRTLPTSGELIYYFQNTASSIATYYKQLTTPYTPSTALTTVGVVNAQVLYNFATDAGAPNRTFIPLGLISVNIHAYQSAGTKISSVYAEIWEVSNVGVDIAKIATTGNSIALTGVSADLFITYSMPTNYILASTASRIVTRVIANVTGGGSAPTIVVNVGATTDSRLSLPSNDLT